MKGIEFIDRVKRSGRERGVEVVWDRSRGKGGHGTLSFDLRRTMIRDCKDELKTEALHGMLTQLGLTLNGLYRR